MKTLYNEMRKQGEEIKKEPAKILTPAIYSNLFVKTEYLTYSDLFMRLLYDRR